MFQWFTDGGARLPAIGSGIRFQFGLLHCALLILLVSQSTGIAVAGTSAPNWIVPNTLTSDDGYAFLGWTMPEGQSAGFFKITETFEMEMTIHYVESTGLQARRVQPGEYEFILQACDKSDSNIPDCGVASEVLTLKVTKAVETTLLTDVDTGLLTAKIAETTQTTSSSITSGGPDQLRPGAWSNGQKANNTWHFYWANRLVLPENDPLFGSGFDLMGIWLTFEAKDAQIDPNCSECPPVTERYRPIAVKFKAVSTGPDTFGGSLYITRSDGSEVWIGAAEIEFTLNNRQATISWSADFKKESLSDTDSLGFGTGPEPSQPTNISHFSGFWNDPGDNSFYVVSLIGEVGEGHVVVFHDDAGDPTWISATLTGTPKLGYRDMCFMYLDSGYSPELNTPPDWTLTWYESGCSGFLSPSWKNRNGSRNFSGVDEHLLWAEFTLPGTTWASGAIAIGTNESPVPLVRSTNFQAVYYKSATGPSCELTSTISVCSVLLTWYTDSYFPDATVFAHNLTTDIYYKVATSSQAVMIDVPFDIMNAGVYVFELRLGTSSGTTLLAITDEFSVSENVVNSPPTISVPGAQTVVQGANIGLSIPVHDIDGDLLSCRDDGSLPDGLSVEISTDNGSCDISGQMLAGIGTYTSVLTVDDGNSHTASGEIVWTVLSAGGNPETPPPPATPPDMTANISSSKVGATVGEFRVNESGSATYSIPILTAPASGGFGPQISLNYSSQSGNGELGVGWSLGGVSAVSLCPQTMEQDGVTGSRGIGLDGEDRFCLDGQRLVVDPSSGEYGDDGTNYRTEIDSFARITSYGTAGNGPAWFKVEHWDGSVVEYGNSADSRIEARGSKTPATVFTWAQNRLEDRAGNYILYGYLENSTGPVAYVLQTIDYTGNVRAGTLPSARLTFTYSDRGNATDLAYNYFAGVQLEQSHLLQNIRSQGRLQTDSPLGDLRFYQLSYEEDGVGRNILTAVTECRSANRTICYQPTRFNWLKSESSIDTSATALDGLLPKLTVSGMLLADVSGDGRPDLLYTKSKSQRHFLYVKEATADAGFSEWVTSYRLPKTANKKAPRVFAIDINSDGLQDVVYSKYTKATEDYTWVALVSNGSGFLTERELNSNHRFFLNDPELGSRFRIMDFNGDGLSDILQAHTDVLGKTWQSTVLLNSTVAGGSPALSAPIKLNVDNADLFPLRIPSGGELSGYPHFFNWELTSADKTDIPDARIFDFNGDGAVDLLLNVWRNYQVCISNCVLQAAANGRNNEDPVYQHEFISFWVLMESNGQNAFSRYAIVALGEKCTVVEICKAPEYETLPQSKYVWPVDINADGLADLAWGSPGSNWYFQLNTGKGYAAAELIGRVPAGANKLVRFEDWNGDAFPDLIYPSDTLNDNAKWMLYQNHFGRAFAAATNTQVPAGNVGGDSEVDPVQNDASVFADFDGDGKTDLLSIDIGKKGAIRSSTMRKGMNVSGSRLEEPANVITSIISGLGAATEITYKPLTDGGVYTRTYDSGAVNWGQGAPVYDYIAPFYVVSEVSGSTPTFEDPAAHSRAEYHYIGAKLQAGGRGLLGFAEIIVYDPQLQIRTNTRYRQDFPFIGLPVETIRVSSVPGSKFSPMTVVSSRQPIVWPMVTSDSGPPTSMSGTLLGYSVNHWQVASTFAGSWQVYADTSLLRNYTLSGNLESKVLTKNSFDTFGNMTRSAVSTFADDGTVLFSDRTTDNLWSEAVTSDWSLGSLIASTVTHARASKAPVIRKSGFEYDPVTAFLVKETIEPGSTKLEIATTFTYDLFGNRETTSKKGAGMNSRTGSVTYDSLGRFVMSETNALGQVFRRVNSSQRDVYGNPLQIENIDGVVSTSAVDLMGRPFASYNQTGAWQKTLNYPGTGDDCPAGTVWYSISTSGGGAMAQQCFDISGRTIRSVGKGINGQLIYLDQYYDMSGRPARVSEPYFKDDARYWNETAYDQLGRVTGLLSAGGDDISINYDEQAANTCTTADSSVVVTTNALGQQTTEVKNVLGETIESFDDNCGQVSFNYDSMGYLTKVTGADGNVVSMNYDGAGRKIFQSDPDKGDWQYAYNALGELTRQLDAKNQAIDFEYDALGRVTHRRELMGVDSLTDSVFTTLNQEVTVYRSASPGKSKVATVTYQSGESGTVIHQRSMSYDWLGRVDGVSSIIGSQQFYQLTTYDSYGRVFQQFDASGNDRGLRYAYQYGHLKLMKEAREGVNGVVYQDILEMDARGNVTMAGLGNGVMAVADYDPANGHLTKMSAYDPFGVELQEVDYLFDVLGNLKSRHDLSANNNLREDFSYDGLNRLQQVQLTAPALGLTSPQETLALHYDATGNISWKSDVGTYTYGSGPAGPHAVTQAGSKTYTYDLNGNQLSGDGRSISYTVFDKATSLTAGNQNTTFTYGIGNDRLIREDSEADILKKTTLYLGNVEYITQADGSTLFKRHLAGAAIATYYPSTAIQQLSYLLKDHIGSIHSVLDEDGLITTRMHFSPFGERQDVDWQTPLDSFLYAPLNDITTRGFTGHEHIDSMGIIHMNGRIYDAKLGRFLQADPFIQAPKNTQSLNRYSYVLNNPLSYTDPSGFFSLGRFIKKWGRTIAAIAVSMFLPGAGGILALQFGVNSAFAQFVITGFIAGGITGGIKGAVKGAFLAAVTYGVTRAFNQSIKGDVQLDENRLAPTKDNLDHMLGTTDPASGLYRIEVGPKGGFDNVTAITADSVRSGNTIFENGMSNNFQDSVRNGTTQVAQLDGVASGYILNFNPTSGFAPDTFESVRDIASTYLGFGQTELAENLARIIDTASKNGVTGLRIIGHSQGAAIATSALRFAADSGLDMNAIGSVNLHGAPINDLFIKNSLAKRTGIGRNSIFIRAQFGDPVYGILGANFITNPLRLPFSAIRIPHLFSGDATLSPHTVPCYGGRTTLCSG